MAKTLFCLLFIAGSKELWPHPGGDKEKSNKEESPTMKYFDIIQNSFYPIMLSKPQLNHNSTQPQPNITLVGLDTKMTLHSTTPSNTTHPKKLNVSNISAVTDPILIKL